MRRKWLLSLGAGGVLAAAGLLPLARPAPAEAATLTSITCTYTAADQATYVKTFTTRYPVTDAQIASLNSYLARALAPYGVSVVCARG